MKIAFYLENKTIPQVDLSQPALGNPGCGGTEYLFAATPFYMLQNDKREHQPILLANNIDHLPDGLTTEKVDDVYAAAKTAKALGADIFVYRPRRKTEMDLLDLITELKLPTIGWAHITPASIHLRKMAKCKYLKALVCVEHEQYDQIQDSLLSTKDKTTFIVNGFDVDAFALPSPPKTDNKLVVYLGALVPAKGFHLLAKVWPRVLSRVPDAKLTVIGTGSLYDKSAKLGAWGIADSRYEEEYLMPYLSGPDGHPHPSICFAGKLGEEKKELIHRALIGVPNPTGTTENCPGSALEFQACGTAVVSGAYWGMIDTISHGVTGLLGKNEQDLINNICFFLENPDKAQEHGKNGPDFIRNRYNWDKVIQQWDGLFNVIVKEEKIQRKSFKPNFLKHYKFLIFINRFIQRAIGSYFFWPSLTEIRETLYPHLSRIKNIIRK